MLLKTGIGVLFFSSLLVAKVSVDYSVSFVGMSMDYKEYDEGVLLDSESSSYSDLIGTELKYKYKIQDEGSSDYNDIVFTVMALYGNTQYTGSYIDSNLGYSSLASTTSNTIYDFTLEFAHIYQQTAYYKVVVSLGFGYRFWRRALSAQQIEDYTWYSIRPSVAFSYDYKNLNISPGFEYQYGIRPRMYASGFNEAFKLGAANIMEFSLPVEYTINQHFSLYGSYIYQYQKIRESAVVYDSSGIGYLEPQSKAYNEYIKFGIVFKY
ncbi:hypothetical protein LCX93_10240 [Sulfurimonas sp. SWIR-19]|uniref:hypothetical protein n=1 Tax=Sulfurimonas sp. SWIR-19 TaxID=2878390 RepID=UPI001CF3BA50|nr:hypothetical protein [Sulfurimonas sp. SWIR-19]UCM99891.1 hypothetical protein LCX93_10240 [Sulfurimonas sp. SWIR-19]